MIAVAATPLAQIKTDALAGKITAMTAIERLLEEINVKLSPIINALSVEGEKDKASPVFRLATLLHRQLHAWMNFSSPEGARHFDAAPENGHDIAPPPSSVTRH